MTQCSSCYVNFLNNSTVDIRSQIDSWSDETIGQIDTQEVEDQIDALILKTSLLQNQLLELAAKTDLNDTLIADIQNEMTAQGILPGDCPELDSLLTSIQQSNTVIQENVRKPIDDSFHSQNRQLLIAQDNLDAINAIKDIAIEFKC